MTRIVRAGIGLAVLVLLAWLGGCSDSPPGPECCDPPPPEGLIVSDPLSSAGLAPATVSGLTLSTTAGEEVAYVSLPPGTVPAGHTAIIRRVGDGGTIFATVVAGGFDPVPVDAGAGDSIDVLVTDAGGGSVLHAGLMVTARRPPVVVRTQPPRKKTDAPLNAAIVVVFSEPIAEASLSGSSVRLFRGQFPVAGGVRLLQGTGAAVAFVPSAPLTQNTDYRLVVSTAVRDLDGDALETDVTVRFRTGQSLTGPAASIAVSPDTVYLAGTAYQMTATVRDAAGNELIDQQLTWSTSDPTGLAVSPSGLLTGLATGTYFVMATSNDVVGGSSVYVIAGPPASVEVTPSPASVGAAGDTIILIATVRDALQRLRDHPSVTWSSSDVSFATVANDSSGAAGLSFATVTGVSLGAVTITATSGTASGTASVTVVPPLPVASVTVTPDPAAVLVRGTRQLSAAVRDANGKLVAGRLVTWTSDNPAVATVDANGLVTGVSEGAATVIATSEGVSDTADVTVHFGALAFTNHRDGNFEIFVISADGSFESRLTNSTDDDRDPAWSPDGQKIAFWSGRDGDAEIYVMNADGSAQTNLTNYSGGGADIGADFGAAWSPDGQKIAFISYRAPHFGHEIYVMNADGSAQMRLTNAGVQYQIPLAWSPDGQKIAFGSTGGVWVMNADGSAQTRLAEGWSYGWSPDGQKIAFGFEGGIWVMNADGSTQTRLTTGPGRLATWSPDGQTIAFESTRDGNTEIYVVNVDGSAETNLTNNSRSDWGPAWSPDGRKIAFYSARGGSGEIYVMNADGSAPIRLTTNAFAYADPPRWRP